MKMKKVLVAALTIAALATSTSAFAATATYNADTATASLALKDGDITAAGGQMTVAVVPKDFDGSAAQIYYINQGDFATEFANIIANMGLKGEINPANYEIRVCGENMSAPAVFNFDAQGQVIYGDVNGDKSADGLDAVEIAKYVAWMDSCFDDGAAWRLTAGNVTVKRDHDDSVDNGDAVEIAKYVAWMPSCLDDFN